MCRYSNEVFNMTASGIRPSAVETFAQRERERFIARNPKSVALAERARHSLYGGVPMHWMADWSTPVPLFVERAKGARFYDVDGHEYIDFCLGDTGTMFGHSPDPIATAIAEQGNNGLTTMLPGEDAVVCCELLAARFAPQGAALGPRVPPAQDISGVRRLLPRHGFRRDGALYRRLNRSALRLG